MARALPGPSWLCDGSCHARGAPEHLTFPVARPPTAKIQSIYNGNLPPITMQRLERETKKPPAQEQWETMKRTMRKTMETMRIGTGYTSEVVTAGTKGADYRSRGIIDIARISPNGFVLQLGPIRASIASSCAKSRASAGPRSARVERPHRHVGRRKELALS